MVAAQDNGAMIFAQGGACASLWLQKKQAVARIVETGGWNEAMCRFSGRKLFRSGDLARPWIDEDGFCGKIRKDGEIDVNCLRFRNIDERP